MFNTFIGQWYQIFIAEENIGRFFCKFVFIKTCGTDKSGPGEFKSTYKFYPQ
jgi:hypothetical protein